MLRSLTGGPGPGFAETLQIGKEEGSLFEIGLDVESGLLREILGWVIIPPREFALKGLLREHGIGG